MSIDQHVAVTVVVNNAGIALTGFGTVAVLTYKDNFNGLSATYSRLADVIADGFASDSPEALAVGKILGQSPHSATVKLIKGTRPPTQKYTLVASAVENETDYDVSVKGEGVEETDVSYTSDTAATAAEIHNGLLALLNAVVDKNYTAAFPALVFPDTIFTAAADDLVTIAAHGLQTGDGPFRMTTSAADLPLNLLIATDYWVIRIDANTFKLATTLALALAGTPVDIGDAGTGVHTLSDTASTVRPSTSVVVTATTPGDWFSLEVADTTLLQIAQDHVDPGIAADLTAVLVADKDWYYLATCFNSKAMVLEAMEWIEATEFKAYTPQVHDSDVENTAAGNGDVVDEWSELGYKRSFPIYHRKPDQMIGAGFCGRVAPLSVGKWSGAYMSITGATRDLFSSQQTTYLDAKMSSYYKEEAGFSIMWETKVSNTSYGFFDVTVALDFVLDLIQKRAFAVKVAMANAGGKVGFTDDDIQGLLLPAVEGAVDICKSDKHKIIAPGIPGDVNDPQPSVSFPFVRDIAAGSRALRELPDGDVSFRLQGAVHKTFIDVNVSF